MFESAVFHTNFWVGMQYLLLESDGDEHGNKDDDQYSFSLKQQRLRIK